MSDRGKDQRRDKGIKPDTLDPDYLHEGDKAKDKDKKEKKK